MDSTQVISLSATVASLVVALMAIWLSVVFFRMSSEISEHTKEAAKGIGASVERLEKLFDKLYADTFSMMRDTVSDMRRHIWPEDTSSAEALTEEAEQRADEKLADLRSHMETELAQVLSRQMAQDERIQSLLELMDRAIANSREVASEARDETIREHIMRALGAQRRTVIPFYDLLEDLPVNPVRARRELIRLQEEGLVLIEGEILDNPSARIHVSPELSKRAKRLVMRRPRGRPPNQGTEADD